MHTHMNRFKTPKFNGLPVNPNQTVTTVGIINQPYFKLLYAVGRLAYPIFSCDMQSIN